VDILWSEAEEIETDSGISSKKSRLDSSVLPRCSGFATGNSSKKNLKLKNQPRIDSSSGQTIGNSELIVVKIAYPADTDLIFKIQNIEYFYGSPYRFDSS
jgi:hypothetical protein